MLKKAKVRLTAWGITGFVGAGSLFSGLATHNVYADESKEEMIMETYAIDTDVPDISGGDDLGMTGAEEGSLSAEKNEIQQDITEVNAEVNNDENMETEAGKTAGVGATNETGNTYAAESVRANNGWVKESGGYKYYKNGKAYTGWHKMGKAEGEKTEHWSYFGKNGIVYTGWKKMGKAEGEKTEHWSYFGSNGWLRTGWVQFGKGTAEPDGNVAKHWSYFGSNGWLRTGWVQFGKGTAEPDGNVAKHWSYFGGNGWLRTGWVQFGKGTAEPDGNVAKHWSYFGGNGWLRTGWQDMGKGTDNPDGNAAKHKSYFGSNGWMRTGTQIISDRQYTFDDRGWLRENYDVDVFINYLRSEYKKAVGYVDGYPAMLTDNNKYYSFYKKYAIADVDGDGQNELVIIKDYVPSAGTVISLYEKRGNTVERSAGAMLFQSVDKLKISYYNNGVIVVDGVGRGNGTGYVISNRNIGKKLGLHYELDNYVYKCLVSYHKEGNGMVREESSQDGWSTDLSVSQYENEMKLLTSRKKINLDLKDVKAKNLNI